MAKDAMFTSSWNRSCAICSWPKRRPRTGLRLKLCVISCGTLLSSNAGPRARRLAPR